MDGKLQEHKNSNMEMRKIVSQKDKDLNLDSRDISPLPDTKHTSMSINDLVDED